MDLFTQTATELRQSFISGKASAVEIVESFARRIQSIDAKVKAYLTLTLEPAKEQAKHLDAKRARDEKLGALASVPIAIKDNICTKGVRTTCASKILENFVPPYDATVIERLKAADAIFLGKTNLDEFAMGSSTENSAFFPTRNPHDLERIPGGSSGGSAAAVAAGETCLALGSDTGGSIRQPAALTGIVGFKPTYGRVSRYGLVAFASSLDQIGPLARTVADAALLSNVLCGKDPMDATSVEVAVPDFHASLTTDLRNLKIGVPKEYFASGLDAEVKASVSAALKSFEALGAKLIECSLPLSPYGIATYYLVAPSEASSNLARYDGVHYGYRSAAYHDVFSLYAKSRAEGFGAEVKRRIMLGTYALSSGYYEAYYLRALKVRRLIKEDFDRAFEKVDVVVGPTSPTPAFKLGERTADPLQMYLCDIFTVSANLAGLPAISLPCGTTKAGLPIGLQIQAKAFDDLKVLQVAHAFEEACGISNRLARL